jgi:outer membrane immunogenic protein
MPLICRGVAMSKLATCAAIAALIGTPAFAADMAVKAPPAPAPAPVYNWTGWYVGVNAGASFGNVKTDFNGAPVFAESTCCGTVQVTPGFGFSDRNYPSGFIGGGQIGYNWQYSPLIVVGLEADFQGALEKDTSNLGPQNFSFEGQAGAGSEGTLVAQYSTQIDWFGTVRARIGYVWGGGNVMSYLTGGLAYGEVKINGATTLRADIGSEIAVGPFSATDTFSHSHVNTGWVLGYGTEGRLGTSNWTWKIEGLYMDLGHVDATGTSSISCTGVCAFLGDTHLTGGQVTTHSHFTDGILRGGLNYKFY